MIDVGRQVEDTACSCCGVKENVVRISFGGNDVFLCRKCRAELMDKMEQAEEIKKKELPEAMLVAEYIVSYCDEKNLFCSGAVLQTVLFLLQCESLRKSEKPFFRDEVSALGFGPGVFRVFVRFQRFGYAEDIALCFSENETCALPESSRRQIRETVGRCLDEHLWTSVAVVGEESLWKKTLVQKGLFAVIPRSELAEAAVSR